MEYSLIHGHRKLPACPDRNCIHIRLPVASGAGSGPRRALHTISYHSRGRAETRQFARMLGLKSKNTAVRSPVSNGIAESFMKTIKRDYISIMPKLVVCFLWSSLCSVLRKNILEPVEQMNAWIRGAINKKKKWK